MGSGSTLDRLSLLNTGTPSGDIGGETPQNLLATFELVLPLVDGFPDMIEGVDPTTGSIVPASPFSFISGSVTINTPKGPVIALLAPEPSTALLLGVGLTALAAGRNASR